MVNPALLTTAHKTLLVLNILTIAEALKSKKRKTWSKQWLMRRSKFSCYENLMRELAFEDPEGYRRYMRMDTHTFEVLLNYISPDISKKNTILRKAIPAAERLALTLRFLATGETQMSLHYQFRIGQSTVCGIILEVCTAIYRRLKSEVMRTPSTEEEWLTVADSFWTLWNFPNCIGAMDGKHVRISPPPNSGSVYYNYKGNFSIVLLAVVDATLKFLYVDVGTNGRVSDGGVWERCNLRASLQSNSLGTPAAASLPGTDIVVPHVIVADDAFPLTTTIMKPYPGRGMTPEQIIFNYRLSRARRVSENAFGILATRFRIFQTSILGMPSKVKIYVLAACCLHNFLRARCIEREGMSSLQGEALMEAVENSEWQRQAAAFKPLARRPWKGNQEAKLVRHTLCEFFNSTGAVDFQEKMCLLH